MTIRNEKLIRKFIYYHFAKPKYEFMAHVTPILVLCIKKKIAGHPTVLYPSISSFEYIFPRKSGKFILTIIEYYDETHISIL